MNNTATINNAYTLSDFDYQLPQERIARYPLAKRDESLMMVIDRQAKRIEHCRFKDIPSFVSAGDCMVFNNAKVLPVRLIGNRVGYAGEVEIFLLHPEDEARTQWLALNRPAKKCRPGCEIEFKASGLRVTIMEQLGEGKARIQLAWPEGTLLDDCLEAAGQLPLPPYMNRSAEAIDTDRYQTVYAKTPGAQAAPTAGLHFSTDVLQALDAQKVTRAELSLMVSAGTFRPVNAEQIHQHRMEPEYYTLDDAACQRINASKDAGGKIIAVGTTSIKTLETVARKYHGVLKADADWSELFITPGFSFQVADALLTNFHLPKSTLLMLVSAFAGRDLMMQAYQAAIEKDYRFYSYGDCMLIL